MAENVNPGTVAQLKSGGKEPTGVSLQVLEIEGPGAAGGKYKVQLTDGKETISAVLASQVGSLLRSGEMTKHAIIRVTAGTVNQVQDTMRLLVTGAEVLGAHEGALGGVAAAPVKKEPQDAEMQDAAAAEPAAKTPGPAVRGAQQSSAAAGAAGEAKTPAAELKREPGAVGNPYTPAAHPTPPSAGWAKLSAASAAKRACQPIAALNPYNNAWTIKAKLVSKGQKRSFSKSGAAQSVFSAELVDEQGTTIEATFWREAADKYFDALEDGKVYLLSKGAVKPANKKFAAVRNDYTLHFDSGALVEECSDEIDTSKMQARMEFVPIDQLVFYADKKMTVDVVGVVVSAAPLGSVKRKTDQQELSRRDITITDQSLKTVVVTLWGAAAEGVGAQIEEQAPANPVVAISACRVSSYNGVSLSGLARSVVQLNPDVPEAQALREWYDSSGREATLTHAGEGLESAIKRGAGAAQQRSNLTQVRDTAPSSSDEKPTYSTVSATCVFIDSKKDLYYMACPDNNRKVTEQDGRYFCEYDGNTYDTMTRRYILAAKLADDTGEMFVQVFNDQADVLMGMKADDLAPVRDGEPSRFAAVMRDRTWRQYVLRIKAQAQEYNGEQRVRYAVADIKPMDYGAESRRLLGLIGVPAAA